MEIITIQPEKRTNKRTETHACDCISRAAAIDAFLTELTKRERKNLLHTWSTVEVKYFVTDMMEHMPSAEPEIKEIGYQDCSNAMLRMWMDNVVNDWEYTRIMDKLNAHWEMEVEHDTD